MFSPDKEDNSFDPNRKVFNSNRNSERRKRSLQDDDSLNKSKKLSIGKSESKSKTLRLSNSVNTSGNTSTSSHPAVSDKKSGISHSTPLLTSSKGRRSLIERSKCILQDETFNDDAEELRIERENQISGQDSAIETDKDSNSLKILAQCLDIELSTEQLSAHLASCIELNAANKININNAFNLKLIDYMVVLLRRNDKSMKDFPTMSCSLDASSRIYACRVDKVHAGVMEIVNGLAGAIERKRNKKLKSLDDSHEDGVSDNEDEADGTIRHGKTKKRKMVLASSPKAVNRNSVEVANWMMHKAIEPNFTALFNHAKIVQSLESNLSLLKDSFSLIPDKPVKNTTREQFLVDVEIPVSGPLYEKFSLFSSSLAFSWNEEREKENQSIVQCNERREVMGTAVEEPKYETVDVEPTCTEFPDVPSDCDLMPDEPNADDSDGHEDYDMDIESVSQHAQQKSSRSIASVDMLSMAKSSMVLADDDNAYSYLNSDFMPMMWAGPEHWKPVLKRGRHNITLGRNVEEKKAKKLKKKTPDGISYDDFTNLSDVFSRKVNSNLQSKAIKKWSEIKVTYPVKKEFLVKTFYRAFLPKTMFWKPKVKQEKNGDIKVEAEYADNVDEALEGINLGTDGTMVFKGLEDISDDEDRGSVNDNMSDNGDFTDNLEPEVNDEKADVNNPSQICNLTKKDDLVPLPRMVDCGTINYATVPKRVNMKKLKETVWNLMDIDGDKENVIRNPTNKNSHNSVAFSNIYKELPNNMHIDQWKDLSPALVFLSILHLANENTLQLTSTDPELFTDFTMRRDS